MNERGLAKKVAGNPKLTQSPGTDEILNFGNFQIVVQLHAVCFIRDTFIRDIVRILKKERDKPLSFLIL